jgi:hypothetical protein
LRDARTLRDLEEAVRIIHLIIHIIAGQPLCLLVCVDATHHPQEDVRDEFNTSPGGVCPNTSYDARSCNGTIEWASTFLGGTFFNVPQTNLPSWQNLATS